MFHLLIPYDSTADIKERNLMEKITIVMYAYRIVKLHKLFILKAKYVSK